MGLIFSLTMLESVIAVESKKRFGYDDSLDAFGVHGVAGIVGALLTFVLITAVLMLIVCAIVCSHTSSDHCNCRSER